MDSRVEQAIAAGRRAMDVLYPTCDATTLSQAITSLMQSCGEIIAHLAGQQPETFAPALEAAKSGDATRVIEVGERLLSGPPSRALVQLAEAVGHARTCVLVSKLLEVGVDWSDAREDMEAVFRQLEDVADAAVAHWHQTAKLRETRKIDDEHEHEFRCRWAESGNDPKKLYATAQQMAKLWGVTARTVTNKPWYKAMRDGVADDPRTTARTRDWLLKEIQERQQQLAFLRVSLENLRN